MKGIAIAGSVLLFAASASAQEPSPPATLAFHFVHTALPVPEYTLIVREDGLATYAATYAPPAVVAGRYSSPAAVVQPAGQAAGQAQVTQTLTLSPETTARLFERVRNTNHLQGCESKVKNIANTGAKTITYSGPDGHAECTYNFTENKAVANLAETFQGISQTLDQGRSIDFAHRYDRLGLDRQLALLSDALHDGRAIEISTIAPILQSLCDDSQVMDRVRKRAATLLATGASTAH